MRIGLAPVGEVDASKFPNSLFQCVQFGLQVTKESHYQVRWWIESFDGDWPSDIGEANSAECAAAVLGLALNDRTVGSEDAILAEDAGVSAILKSKKEDANEIDWETRKSDPKAFTSLGPVGETKTKIERA